MSRLRIAGVVLATVAPLLVAVAPASAGPGPCGAPTAPDEWPTFGRDLANTRTQEQAGDISPTTAPTLQPVWSFSTGAAANAFSDLNGTPIVSGGCVYLNTAGGDVVALESSDGTVVWRHHVGVITGRSGSGWIVKSGNDGNRVRERVRSISGAIAFRHVGGANLGS